jgi:secreted Zn-dependent insulinase-like peptidase
MENLVLLTQSEQETFLSTQSPSQLLDLFKQFENNEKFRVLAESLFSVFFQKTDETDPIYQQGLIFSARFLANSNPLQSLSKLLAVTQLSETATDEVFPVVRSLIVENKGNEFLSILEKFIEITTGLNQVKYLKVMADVQPSVEIFNNIWEIIYELNPQIEKVREILNIENELMPEPLSSLVPSGKPRIVYKSKFLETWWTCDIFECKAFVYLGLLINDLRSTLQKSVTADLIGIILTLGLNNELGLKLAQAGIQMSLEPLENCLEIKVSGHASKVLDASEKIIEFIYNSSPTSETFESAVILLRQQYQSMISDPANQSRQLRLAFLQHQQYLYSEKLKYLSGSSYTDLNFANVKILLLAAGNISESQTSDLAEFIDGLLFAADGKKLKYLTPRTVTLLPDQIIELVQNSFVDVGQESVIEVYFQFGQSSIEERVLTTLTEMIINENIQDELVIQKKKCSAVAVTSRMTRGVSGLLIKVITLETHPDEVQMEIFEFVAKLGIFIEKTFEEKKKTLVELKMQGFRNLADKSSFFWDEILQGNLEFERDFKEIEYLKSLDVKTLIEWVERNKMISKALVVKIINSKWGTVSHRFTEEFAVDTENVRNRIPCYSWLRIMH